MGIDTSSYGKEVADVISKSDALMEKVKPDALVILGDTYVDYQLCLLLIEE